MKIYLYINDDGTIELAAYGKGDSVAFFVATLADRWHAQALINALAIEQDITITEHSLGILNG